MHPLLRDDPELTPWIYAVHVISEDDTPEGGNIPMEQISAQMSVLNDDYAPSGVSFELDSITRTVDATWFTSIGHNQCVFTISPLVTLAH